MTVGDEDIAAGRDEDIRWLIESIRIVSGDSRFAELDDRFKAVAETAKILPLFPVEHDAGHATRNQVDVHLSMALRWTGRAIAFDSLGWSDTIPRLDSQVVSVVSLLALGKRPWPALSR